MAGKILVRYDIPSDVETAYAAISSDAWATKKAEVLKDDSKVVSRTVADGDAVTLVVSRKLPDGIPGFLTKFLPADGKVTQTDAWGPAVDGVRKGTWVADTPGSPAKVSGTMRLEPKGDGCQYVVEGTAKVSIPLVGGKAEGVVVGMTEKLTAKEADVLRTLVS
ncbi:MAG: hypothetical protein JWO12_2381 [Frankiales bacterium]|nr:hypothetical protein [Frankiales bacterium]